MTRVLWASVAWKLVAVSSVLAQTTVRLSGGSWSLTLPETWKVADEATLNRMNQQVAQAGLRTPDGPVRYVMMAVSKAGDGCYMLVQQSRGLTPGASFEPIVKRMREEAGNSARGVQPGKGVSGGSFSGPEVDNERKRAVLTGVMEAPGAGRLKYYSSPMFGAAETITLHVYAPEAMFESKRAELRGMIDSFAFEAGKGYTFSAQRGFSVNQVLMYGLVGAGVGLLVWAMRKAAGRR